MTAILPPEALARALALARSGPRRLLGLAGPPGAGKSTVCAALLQALGPLAAAVPMDGFHLAQSALQRLGRAAAPGPRAAQGRARHLRLGRIHGPAAPPARARGR